ncbi:MAG: metallopeptidase family protein [Rhodobacteraceae bacterium]|nr:metallopeptidase family protein [Paracoccaceae bacterium]
MPAPPSPYADLAAPDLAAFETLAQAAVARLPEPYRQLARALPLRIEDFPPEEILEEMGIDDAFELTGLYDGVPLTERSVSQQPERPEAIWLFRRPILDEWAERVEVSLGELVAHVFVHELAHHFGWSDEEIARIAPWAE